MSTGRKIPTAARMAVAALAIFGLAACEPQLPGTAPANGGTPNYGGMVTTTTAPANNSSTITAPSGWRYAGGDEFNGTSVDGSKWSTYHNTYGEGNKELACLTPGNASVSGGSLQIRARRQSVTCPGGKARSYTSAFLGSREAGKYYPKYARFEMRGKLPHAQGLWPAFWLRHQDGAGVAEVDVMEYFHSQVPGKTSQTLHLDGRDNISKKATWFESATLSPGWHTWAVEIGPATGGVKFTFFVDGTAVHSFVDTQHHWTSSAPDSGTWDIALNMAVGGNWVGGPDDALGLLPNVGRCSLGGTYPNHCSTTGIKRVDWSNPAATTYQVDYVRVFTRA